MSELYSLEDHLAKTSLHEEFGVSTIGIHGDDELALTTDVAPPIHVSTTYRYNSDPSKLQTAREVSTAYDRQDHIYSRISHRSVLRAEKILGEILDGHAVLFSSGLSAFHAMLLHYNPKNVFIGDGYHGCHSLLKIYQRNFGTKVHHNLDTDPELLQKGDIIHLESPVNPTGLAFDIEHYAKIAHSRGAFLVLDATFAPPPLQDPWSLGVDMVMHSGTKYFGGHSDLLSGILVSKDEKVASALMSDRDFTGASPGSLESWLLLRSLRTYHYRIRLQYESANKIVKYLADNISKLPKLEKIYHSSLQTEDFVKKQLPLGGPPVFSIELKDRETARYFPSKLKLFHHATSLGGAESLIEWRCMTDMSVSESLLRVSIGLEDTNDLIGDLVRALQ
ncbi:putative cystathionine beta-lyase [Sugiyamaella lignohabitans]|uniref:Putative cystathionine beta-lyase n=1 Tax=Sugiyamaella lignohabitans TaxID=796027 RepID=A0A167CYK3_9ASCO|nr:putative cystathionine beta-lyase [Sugiyamaella lignohabitans]ANB12261.1 putative cystathionine beta-lyase [Sugiyamaella lignohabitans]